MELIGRYLQAVKFWLPKEQKQDIIAELSEDLYSQIEEREAQVGRKLDDTEVEAMLMKRGRPVLPMPTASYLWAKMMMTMLFSAIIMARIILAAAAFGHTGLRASQFVATAVVDILGPLPFCAIRIIHRHTRVRQERPGVRQSRLSAHDAFGRIVLPAA
jgi:hypothetical protein